MMSHYHLTLDYVLWKMTFQQVLTFYDRALEKQYGIKRGERETTKEEIDSMFTWNDEKRRWE